VQAGEFRAEQQRRAAAGRDEVGRRAQTRQRGIAAHVADEEALQRRRHAHVPGQQDVQARRRIAGAGADHQQAQLVGGDPGLGERPADRLLGQRHGLHLVAAHPALGGPAGDVLQQRADRRLPGADPRVGEDPLRQPAPATRVVLGEEALPQLVLCRRRR
jgi:hypothetical protein